MSTYNPLEYEFCTAPLNPPRTGMAQGSRLYSDVPDDLYTSVDWVLVQVVSTTSGGGSYPSTSALQGGSYEVSSSVLGVFARRRSEPWTLAGKCYCCGRQAEWKLVRKDGSGEHQCRCTNCVGLTFTYTEHQEGATPETKGWVAV